MTRLATDLHADAVAVLTAYAPANAHQAQLRDDYLWLLAERPDATWRECLPAHLTASAVVLDAAGEQALLILHGKAHKWLQMGGHCEPSDRSMAAAALREAAEESGVRGLRLLGDGPVLLDRHPAPCAAEHHYDVMYAAVAPEGAAGEVTEETLGIGWFLPDALPQPTDDAVRALVAAAMARFRTSGI